MATADDFRRFEKLVHRFDPHARLKSHKSLPGGYSADVTVLVLETPAGAEQKLVHRLHGAKSTCGRTRTWLQTNSRCCD